MTDLEPDALKKKNELREDSLPIRAILYTAGGIFIAIMAAFVSWFSNEQLALMAFKQKVESNMELNEERHRDTQNDIEVNRIEQDQDIRDQSSEIRELEKRLRQLEVDCIRRNHNGHYPLQPRKSKIGNFV